MIMYRSLNPYRHLILPVFAGAIAAAVIVAYAPHFLPVLALVAVVLAIVYRGLPELGDRERSTRQPQRRPLRIEPVWRRSRRAPRDSGTDGEIG